MEPERKRNRQVNFTVTPPMDQAIDLLASEMKLKRTEVVKYLLAKAIAAELKGTVDLQSRRAPKPRS